jgi:hypothetical protein
MEAYVNFSREVADKHEPFKQRRVLPNQVHYMNVTRRKAIYKKKMLCHKYQKCRTSENWKNYTTQRNYVRDRPFNLKRGLWFFVSFRKFFSDNTRVRIFTFFPEFKIRLYDKNSESDYFFSSTKFRIFFSATL